MSSMNNAIPKYDSKVMKHPAPSTSKTCIFHRKMYCTMDGNDISDCIIYKASVNTTTNKYYYYMPFTLTFN